MPANDALLARRPRAGGALEPSVAVDDLERAAAGIRPSWADAERTDAAPRPAAPAPQLGDAISPSDPTEIDFDHRRWRQASWRRHALIAGAALAGGVLALWLVRATTSSGPRATAPLAQHTAGAPAVAARGSAREQNLAARPSAASTPSLPAARDQAERVGALAPALPGEAGAAAPKSSAQAPNAPAAPAPAKRLAKRAARSAPAKSAKKAAKPGAREPKVDTRGSAREQNQAKPTRPGQGIVGANPY